jgi:hypothetical protein
MAAIQPVLGFGITLKRAASTTVGDVSFTAIDGVTNIKPPGFAGTEIDVTQHVLGAVKRRAKVSGLSDTTPCNVTIYYDPDLAQHAAILNDNETLVYRDYELEFPDTTNRWRFRGQVITFDVQAVPVDGFLMANLVFSILTLDTTVP